jgi:ABC-type nitrate/sulfonate/bicarbonate transport system substrate-binding protein
MPRRLHLLGVPIMAALASIAIERSTPAAEPIPIKFVTDWAWEGTQASWAVAAETGCYTKAGLDVKTDRGFGSGDAIAKVAGELTKSGLPISAASSTTTALIRPRSWSRCSSSAIER